MATGIKPWPGRSDLSIDLTAWTQILDVFQSLTMEIDENLQIYCQKAHFQKKEYPLVSYNETS